MENLLMHIAAILTVSVVCGIIYILANHYLRDQLVDYVKCAWHALKEMFSLPKDYKDSDIRDCIKKAFQIRSDIAKAGSKAELEAAYWDIKKMDDDFRGIVPQVLLDTHLEQLYEKYSNRRARMFVRARG